MRTETGFLSGVLQDLFLLVGAPPDSHTHLSLIPSSNLQEFWLGLHHFDLSAQGKNGYYPSNCQFAARTATRAASAPWRYALGRGMALGSWRATASE